MNPTRTFVSALNPKASHHSVSQIPTLDLTSILGDKRLLGPGRIFCLQDLMCGWSQVREALGGLGELKAGGMKRKGWKELK